MVIRLQAGPASSAQLILVTRHFPKRVEADKALLYLARLISWLAGDAESPRVSIVAVPALPFHNRRSR